MIPLKLSEFNEFTTTLSVVQVILYALLAEPLLSHVGVSAFTAQYCVVIPYQHTFHVVAVANPTTFIAEIDLAPSGAVKEKFAVETAASAKLTTGCDNVHVFDDPAHADDGIRAKAAGIYSRFGCVFCIKIVVALVAIPTTTRDVPGVVDMVHTASAR